MQRIQDDYADAALPAPPARTGVLGFFRGGNPSTGTLATRVRAWWLNMVQEELLGAITGFGIAPAAPEADLAQLQKAISRAGATNYTYVNSNRGLTVDQAGLVVVDASVNTTLALPKASAMGGRSIEFQFIRYDTNAAVVAIAPAAGDSIEGAINVDLPQKGRLTLRSNGGDVWWVVAETARGALAANPGYVRLPGGLIMQFARNITGTTNASGDATIAFTYPLAFPIGEVFGYSITANDEATARNNATANVFSVTRTFLSAQVKVPGGQAGTLCAISGFVIGR